jgi:tungstate transport system substrate-binding protein
MQSTRPVRGRTRAGVRHRSAALLHRRFTPAALLVAATLLVAPSLARADSSSTFTVVGTSEVNDSGLMSHVIASAFEGAYPQYAFKFVSSSSSQAAVAAAEAGGPSVLIAANEAVESQFVASGYSYEPYGRALFGNDFVLAGPGATDPAGVKANATNNIAQAFADVATAGIAGKAEFVSRGGTSGQSIEEHAIWGLVAAGNLEPTGLVLCTVSAANGGGDAPIAASAGVANGAPCPSGGAVPSSKQLPSWYAVAGSNQGATVLAANNCSGYPSGAGSCYVFTDSGTFDYLISGTDSAGTISNLGILTQDNAATAPGGAGALVNNFHAYIINPTKPGESVNLPAAQFFVNLITSAGIQSAIGEYLAGSFGGNPYTAAAAPVITTKPLPEKLTASGPLTITGTVSNAQPGYPAPSGVVVTLRRVSGDESFAVASAKTSSTGAFTIKTPLVTEGTYKLTTPQFSQVELPTLSPPFGDILAPASTEASWIAVHGAITGLAASSIGGGALVTGAVSPSSGHVSGKVTVYARRIGAKGASYRKVASTALGTGDGHFAAVADLPAGRWQLAAYFADPGTVATSAAANTTVTVASERQPLIASRGVSAGKGGQVTAHVALYPKPAKGTTVRLIAVSLSGNSKAATRVLDTVKPTRATRLVTLHGTLTGGHWALLESYTVPHGATAWTHALGHVTVQKATKQK